MTGSQFVGASEQGVFGDRRCLRRTRPLRVHTRACASASSLLVIWYEILDPPQYHIRVVAAWVVLTKALLRADVLNWLGR